MTTESLYLLIFMAGLLALFLIASAITGALFVGYLLVNGLTIKQATETVWSEFKKEF